MIKVEMPKQIVFKDLNKGDTFVSGCYAYMVLGGCMPNDTSRYILNLNTCKISSEREFYGEESKCRQCNLKLTIDG